MIEITDEMRQNGEEISRDQLLLLVIMMIRQFGEVSYTFDDLDKLGEKSAEYPLMFAHTAESLIVSVGGPSGEFQESGQPHPAMRSLNTMGGIIIALLNRFAPGETAHIAPEDFMKASDTTLLQKLLPGNIMELTALPKDDARIVLGKAAEEAKHAANEGKLN